MAASLANFLSNYAPEPCCPSLNNPATREVLQKAILGEDPELFRQTLQDLCPDICTQRRLFGVLVENSGKIMPVMVTQDGRPLGRGDTLEVGVPIELLNVKLKASGLEAVINGQIWRVQG